MTCWWCGEESISLCDAVIGSGRRLDNTIIMDEAYTCDAEMCAEHSAVRGFVCGDDPDTIDMCPEHRETQPNLDQMARSRAESDAARSGTRSRALRSRIRLEVVCERSEG